MDKRGVDQLDSSGKISDTQAGELSELPGSFCANCGTPVQGSWCYACGQKFEDSHRSVRHLAVEALEGLTEADSRLWTTLRLLAVRPALLTRQYLAGKRAPQVPPFRLFFFAVVLFFFASSIGNLGPNKTHIKFADPTAAHAHGITVKALDNGTKAWLNTRMARAARDPDRAIAEMERWAHAAAILSVLIAAPLMALMFAGQRRFYFYDHLIFSMHSLAFQGLLLSVTIILGGWIMAAWLLLVIAPIHLFVHMRGVYGTTILGTLTRMLILFAGSVLGFGLILTGLVLVGLSAEA